MILVVHGSPTCMVDTFTEYLVLLFEFTRRVAACKAVETTADAVCVACIACVAATREAIPRKPHSEEC